MFVAMLPSLIHMSNNRPPMKAPRGDFFPLDMDDEHMSQGVLGNEESFIELCKVVQALNLLSTQNQRKHAWRDIAVRFQIPHTFTPQDQQDLGLWRWLVTTWCNKLLPQNRRTDLRLALIAANLLEWQWLVRNNTLERIPMSWMPEFLGTISRDNLAPEFFEPLWPKLGASLIKGGAKDRLLRQVAVNANVEQTVWVLRKVLDEAANATNATTLRKDFLDTAWSSIRPENDDEMIDALTSIAAPSRDQMKLPMQAALAMNNFEMARDLDARYTFTSSDNIPDPDFPDTLPAIVALLAEIRAR